MNTALHYCTGYTTLPRSSACKEPQANAYTTTKRLVTCPACKTAIEEVEEATDELVQSNDASNANTPASNTNDQLNLPLENNKEASPSTVARTSRKSAPSKRGRTN